MGVNSTSRGGERFGADEQTIADVFKAVGYITGAFGQWHSGSGYVPADDINVGYSIGSSLMFGITLKKNKWKGIL